jgi:SAM-dependent methyltransferase
MTLLDFVIKHLRPNGKVEFLSLLPDDAVILDVGCGNNSPYRVKRIIPNSNYTGIDVGDHEQQKPNRAERYIITTAEDFHAEISNFSCIFDAVISSHNIEHCNEREKTLEAMLKALKPGGRIYLSFPCEQSTSFPSRGGTLNYFDDSTHQSGPPDFDALLRTLREFEFEITYSTRNYQPKFLWLVGFIFEPLSRWLNANLMGTWEYYGFESIIIATKTRPTHPPDVGCVDS